MTPPQALQTIPSTVDRVDGEWLLAHVLGCRRGEIRLQQIVMTEAQLALWEDLIAKRAKHIPLQHLLGTTEFCGLEIEVNSDVLIPRPETEVLAEAAWQFATKLPVPAVLDHGTGSGCLAIAIAKNCPPAEIAAVDVSAAALKIARANAAKNEVSNQISFFAGADFAALPAGEKFHLIVSNPPYIPTAEIATLQPEVREHDPHLALDGGPDGLGVFRSIAAGAGDWLLAGGKLMVEVGDGQAAAVMDLFEPIGAIEVLRDLNNVQRIVVATVADP